MRFLHAAYGHVQWLPLLRYSHRFSRHTYSQQQLLTILLFKEYLRATYSDIVDLIHLIPAASDILILKTVPHFTTLQSFLARLSSGLLSTLIHYLAEVTLPPDAVGSQVAIDTTGFTCDYASDWYCERTGRRRKAFMKLSVAVDTEWLTLLGFTMSRTPINQYFANILPYHFSLVRAPGFLRLSRVSECVNIPHDLQGRSHRFPDHQLE